VRAPELHPKQGVAVFSTATEILLAGGGRSPRRDRTAISWCFPLPPPRGLLAPAAIHQHGVEPLAMCHPDLAGGNRGAG